MPFVGHGMLTLLREGQQFITRIVNDPVLSKSSSCSTVKHITFLARRVKLAVHVDVDGNIENIWIIIESTLTSIS